MINSKVYAVLITSIFIMVVSACGQTQVSVSTKISVTPSPIVTFTNAPKSTPTPSLGLVITNTPPVSLTPVPTLGISESKTLMLSLYENNGDCKLPCWWGIVPGESTWNDTQNFLSSFAERISSPFASDFFGQVKDYTIHFPFDTQSGNRLSLRILVQDDLIKLISASVNEDIERANNSTKYFMHSILAEYGAPDQVFLYTQPHTPESIFPFSVILFYRNQRFALIYIEEGDPINDQMRACFKNNLDILSWAPNTIQEFDDLTKAGYSTEDIQQYRPLEEVTILDVETFYETFTDPATPFCLETPIELWP